MRVLPFVVVSLALTAAASAQTVAEFVPETSRVHFGRIRVPQTAFKHSQVIETKRQISAVRGACRRLPHQIFANAERLIMGSTSG